MLRRIAGQIDGRGTDAHDHHAAPIELLGPAVVVHVQQLAAERVKALQRRVGHAWLPEGTVATTSASTVSVPALVVTVQRPAESRSARSTRTPRVM